LQVSTALQSGEREIAQRIAHSVKGVAGNLGIKRVQFAAEKLEKAIRDGDAATRGVLEDFTSLLRPQIEAIEQALGTSVRTAHEKDANGSFSLAVASREARRLRSLLEASDGDAERTLRALQSVLVGHVETARLDALGADISEFDFAGALLKLNDIVKENGLNPEEVTV
jgi:HPt (histidine-containing phosphotransfer) domain-containing protein